jgi:hypothetical protein
MQGADDEWKWRCSVANPEYCVLESRELQQAVLLVCSDEEAACMSNLKLSETAVTAQRGFVQLCTVECKHAAI